MEKVKYAFFWGCQIPARLPFMEKSARLVLDKLGVEFVDLEGFTCCPEKALVKNLSEEAWILTAARNLCVAESQGYNIISACNGCYGTLKTVAHKLNTDTALRNKVNDMLGKVGLEYKGKVKIKHLIEFLHDDVGTAKIKSAIEKPLIGMKIAAHYGCHLLRPSSAIHFDDPLKPTKFDLLIEALGARSLDYHTKMMCCGGALSHAGELDESIALTRKKLLELQKIGADALSLTCPQCFMQYDQKQHMAQRKGENLHLPVLTYPELLGLAMGFTSEELGLEAHRVDVAQFLKTWERHLGDFELAKSHIDFNSLKKCYECGACISDCPVAEINEKFSPNRLIGMVLEGKVNELINSKDIWFCVECHTCYELCPQKFGMEKVFTTLKHLAMEKGIMPDPIRGGVNTFLKTGRLGDPDVRTRKKYGLKETPVDGNEELQKLLELLNQEKAQ